MSPRISTVPFMRPNTVGGSCFAGSALVAGRPRLVMMIFLWVRCFMAWSLNHGHKAASAAGSCYLLSAQAKFAAWSVLPDPL
jgi:hypothetical protein